MRILDGEQTLVRIFIGESDKWHHGSLHRALIERLREEGMAGATVIHGIAGFGARRVIHTAGIVDLSSDLPVLIEVVDDDAHIAKLLTIIDMLQCGARSRWRRCASCATTRDHRMDRSSFAGAMNLRASARRWT